MAELIHNLPFADYMTMRGLSASGLKKLASSTPAHYRYAVMHPTPPSPAQALGTHVHGLILEPETYRYAIVPECDRRTKIGKELYAAFLEASADAHIVTQDQHDTAQAMRDAVMSHDFAAKLLDCGDAEVTALWEIDEITCKARFDCLPSGFDVIVDLKTAADASPEGFAKAAGRYMYHIQAAWYSMASEAIGNGPRQMVFIVVESEAPHCVALYMLDQEAIDAASYRIERLIQQYADCKHSGEWPGYDTNVCTLSLPRWSL